MKVFFAVMLILVAVLAGGCSLIFAIGGLMDAGSSGLLPVFAMFFVPGFVVAILCGWGAKSLLSKPKPPQEGR
jgi:hypothetical protein